MWRNRFGADRGIVGRAINLNGVPVTIIGVMPASFYFPNRTAEFWRPLALNQSDASRGGHYLGVVEYSDGTNVLDQTVVSVSS